MEFDLEVLRGRLLKTTSRERESRGAECQNVVARRKGRYTVGCHQQTADSKLLCNMVNRRNVC
jgi:hypothetical protein